MNTFLSSGDWWWATVVLGVAWKSVAVLAGAWAIVLSSRRATAAVRHLVWSAALTGTLALPLLALALPSWYCPGLPAWKVDTATGPRGVERQALPRRPDRITFPRHDRVPGSPGRLDPAIPPEHPVDWRPRLEPTVSAPAAWDASRILQRPLWFWILAAWSAGALPLLAGPLIGRLVLRSSMRGARPLDQNEWAELVRETSSRVGIRRRVLLLRSDRAAMPMTWGWLRPVVMLPAEADQWPPGRRRDVLVHELAHVRRLDCLTQCLAQVACAVYWFNPLAWFASHRMQIERERACDDLVLTAGARPSEYAGHLLEMARSLHSSRAEVLAAIAVARPSQLEGRLRAILDPDVRRGRNSRSATIIAMIGLAALLVPLSTVQLKAQDAATAKAGIAGDNTRGPTPSEPAKPQDVQPVKPPIVIQGKPLSDWREALKDPDPAARKRAVGVLGTLTRDQAGDQWSALQTEINTLVFHDKDREVRQAAATVADLFKVSSPKIRQRILEQQKRKIAPTSTPLRLVDSQGQPVAGARVSTYFERDRDRSSSFTPAESIEEKATDARGEASLTLEIAGHLEGAGVYAIRQEPGQDRPLVGVHNVTRDQIGKPVTITMYPACRVRFRAECPGFRELAAKYNVELDAATLWRAAYVMLGDDNTAPRPLFTHSTSGDLEFLLPPGHYKLMVYGSDVDTVYKPIEIGPEHGVQSLGVVELTPNAAIQQGVFRDFHHWIQPDPQAGLNDEPEGKRSLLRRVEGVGLKGDARSTQGVAYSPDGTLLATAHWYNADPGEVKLWNALTGEFVAALPVSVEHGGVLNLAFSPDGKLLAGAVGALGSSEPPGVVAVWDLAARRTLRTLRGHTARITALAFSPDGKTLASGGEDRSVRFWDVADGVETGRIEKNPGWVRSVIFTAGGNCLVIGSGNTLRLWDVQGNRERTALEPDGFWVHAVSLSPDGRMVASAGSTVAAGDRVGQGQVRLYDISQDPPVRRAELVLQVAGPDRANRRDWWFSAVAFTADGRRVVAVQMTTIVTWDVATGNLKDYIERSSGSSADRLATSPDGRWLAVTEARKPTMIDITPPLAP